MFLRREGGPYSKREKPIIRMTFRAPTGCSCGSPWGLRGRDAARMGGGEEVSAGKSQGFRP